MPRLGSGRRRLAAGTFYGREVPKSAGETLAPLNHNWKYGYKDRDWEKMFENIAKLAPDQPNQIMGFIDAQIGLIELVLYPTDIVVKKPRNLVAHLKKLDIQGFEPDVQLCLDWQKLRAGGKNVPTDDEQKDFFARMLPSLSATWTRMSQDWMNGIGGPALAALVLIGLDVKKIGYMVGKTVFNTELLSFAITYTAESAEFTGWSCATYACYAVGVYYAFYNFKKLGFNIKTGAVAYLLYRLGHAAMGWSVLPTGTHVLHVFGAVTGLLDVSLMPLFLGRKAAL